MTKKAARDATHRYSVAQTTYHSCAQALSDATQSGRFPDKDALKNEEAAFRELRLSWQALLRALEHADEKCTAARSAPSGANESSIDAVSLDGDGSTS